MSRMDMLLLAKWTISKIDILYTYLQMAINLENEPERNNKLCAKYNPNTIIQRLLFNVGRGRRDRRDQELPKRLFAKPKPNRTTTRMDWLPTKWGDVSS